MTDSELLEKHRATADPAAFAEIVRRHIGWVHGVARRQIRDQHLAEDVAQAVFILLHRKAPIFSSDAALTAWLHRTAVYAAKVALRGEQRRKRRETEAFMLRESQQLAGAETNTAAEWQALAPVLDDLIEHLGRRDREAMLLRFYRGMTFPEVAESTGSTEEAVRKRVTRSLEKLRGLAKRKEIEAPAAVLATALTSHAAGGAPPGLIAVATGAALANYTSTVTASALPITHGVSTMMAIAKIKMAACILAGVVLVAAGGTALVWAGATNAPTTQKTDGESLKSYPKLAPYSAIRWEKDVPQIQMDDQWVELRAINGTSVLSIIEFAKKTYGDIWQKRFDEDLVQVLSEMGQLPKETVNLTVGDLQSGAEREVKDVPMTHENRQAIWKARNGIDVQEGK